MDTDGVEARLARGVKLGAEIRKLRRKRGLSRPQLASELGVSETSIYWWESGRHMPHPDNYRALVDLLGPLPRGHRTDDFIE